MLARFREFILAATTSPLMVRRLSRVDLSRVRRLHFVCKGNVCRSAYAAARATEWGLQATSSGVEAGSGKPADATATRVAARRGVRLDDHASANFSEVALDGGDLIVVMEPSQARTTLRRVRTTNAQVTLLGLWNGRRSLVVSDPYGLDDRVFEKCFDSIDTSLLGLYEALAASGSLPRRPGPGILAEAQAALDERRRRNSSRRPERLRYWLKFLLGSVLFRTGIYRWYLRDRAIVFVFHSVVEGENGDSLRIPLTVFEQYLSFFQRYFRMVRLSDLAGYLARGDDISRVAAITFDDGYADNVRLAAPALERHGQTATFFVTTGYIDSQIQSEWDRRKGVRSDWMTWGDVRRLAAAGHEIGGHTVSHADLGALGPEAIRGEIAGSLAKLREETGISPSLFAVPFGNPASIREPALQELGRQGIRVCVTAVGGAVAPGSPLLMLNRFPVDSIEARSPYVAGIDIITDCRTVTRRRVVRLPS